MADNNWKAEMDANTLAEAKVIASSPGRLKAAQEAAAKLSSEQNERAKAMSSVAKSPSVRIPTEQKPTAIKLNGSYS